MARKFGTPGKNFPATPTTRAPTAVAAQKQAIQILANAAEGVIVLDTEWRYLLLNRQSERLLQTSAAPLLGKNILREFPERLGDKFYGACRQAAEQQRIVEIEGDPGAQPPLAIRICPAPSGLCIFLRENGGQQAMLAPEQTSPAALQSLQALTERLTENLDLAGIAYNVAQLCVTSLGAKLAWIGRAQADGGVSSLAYYPTDSTYPPQITARWDEHPTGQGATGRAIRSGKPVVTPNLGADIHFWPWRKAALKEQLQCSAAMPLVSRGRAFGALNLYSDQPGFFTAQRVAAFQMVAHHTAAALVNAQLYGELQQHAAQLEERVAKRTAELEAANRELQTTNYELETFNYTVSRDLCAIRIVATTLLEDHADQLDAHISDNLRRIAASAERGDRLLQDLLAFNLLSHTAIEFKPQQITAAVRGALEYIGMTQRKCVTLARSLPTVMGDAELLKLVFFHLLDNALKFVAPGTVPAVRIHATVHGNQARIWVEDNGIGIASPHHDNIFRLFERLHGVYAGTGVGLATVKKAAERMGGSVGVESEEGKGSRFYVELPLAKKS
ncbi:MAG: ATP-binding protein [Pseudomonadota bacterium]